MQYGIRQTGKVLNQCTKVCIAFHSHSLAVLRLSYTARIGIKMDKKAQFERSPRRKPERLKESNCEVECVSPRVMESMSHSTTTSNLLYLCNHNHDFSH
jgi:hypothetical protein